MIKKNSPHNPWLKKDEKEHFPCLMEWWAAEAFFTSSEDKKKWSLKIAFTEWFENEKKIGSISNMTLFDQNSDKYIVYYRRNDKQRLKSEENRFYVKFEDSFMEGSFPQYHIFFKDTDHNIKMDLKFQAESYPHWVAQHTTNGWLPMGLGVYRYGFIPKNLLTGIMNIHDKTYKIAGKGYFEHVWGDFDYDKPLYPAALKKTFKTYLKLIRWWIREREIKIPKSITFSTDNNPFGYDWVWALFDNGWSIFYGNSMFWIMDGPATGTLILTKDGKTYTEFGNVEAHYKKINYVDKFDFYYPTELEVTARKGNEKIYLYFKTTNTSREYVSKFPYAKYHWIGLSICEMPGVAEGYYFDGKTETKLTGVCKIEPQRQVSKLGHNSLKLNFMLPPKGVGIDADLNSHYLKKRIITRLYLAPRPSIKLNVKKIKEEDYSN